MLLTIYKIEIIPIQSFYLWEKLWSIDTAFWLSKEAGVQIVKFTRSYSVNFLSSSQFLKNTVVGDILPKAFVLLWRSMVHKEAWLISAKQDLFLYQTHSGTLSLQPVFFFPFLEVHSTLDSPFLSSGCFSLAINMTSWFWVKLSCLYLCQLWCF